MKTSSYILLLATVLLTPPVQAQSSNLTQIASSVLASGGGTASAGGYKFTHTLGESIIGNSTASDYTLTVGFWAQEDESNSATDVGFRIHVARVPGGMVLTWDAATAALEQAPSATGPFTAVSGATSPHTVTIGSEWMKFYRLRALWPPNHH